MAGSAVPADWSDVRIYAERINSLLSGSGTQGAAFQSIIISSLKVLCRTLYYEKQALEATISLAQRQKLTRMVLSLEATIDALRGGLSVGGARMMCLVPEPAHEESMERYWWFALSEAMQVVEEGTEQITSIVGGQPRGSQARTLAGTVARLLHRHQVELLGEAERWMGNGA